MVMSECASGKALVCSNVFGHQRIGSAFLFWWDLQILGIGALSYVVKQLQL